MSQIAFKQSTPTRMATTKQHDYLNHLLGLAALELKGSQLAETRKGAWEKEVLTWWRCQHTTVRRRWVSERLGMGDESRVTQAIGRVRRDGQPELERLKSRLEQVYESNNGEVEV